MGTTVSVCVEVTVLFSSQPKSQHVFLMTANSQTTFSGLNGGTELPLHSDVDLNSKLKEQENKFESRLRTQIHPKIQGECTRWRKTLFQEWSCPTSLPPVIENTPSSSESTSSSTPSPLFSPYSTATTLCSVLPAECSGYSGLLNPQPFWTPANIKFINFYLVSDEQRWTKILFDGHKEMTERMHLSGYTALVPDILFVLYWLWIWI